MHFEDGWHQMGADDPNDEGVECEGCGKKHKRNLHLQTIHETLLEAANEPDPERRNELMEGAFGVILQYGHMMTRDITVATKGALMAMGHKQLSWNLQNCVMTKSIGGVLIMGCGFKIQPDLNEVEQHALHEAICAAMWVEGFIVTVTADGVFQFEGSVDALYEDVEATISDFASDIEKELGADADPSTDTKRSGGWW